MEKDLIELGHCKRPHGIKGGFLFFLHNNQNSVLEKGSEITIFPLNESSSIDQDGQDFKIDTIHFGNKVICYFGGIKDRNLVEKMIPFKIFYPRSKFPELEGDQWYVSDLVGLDVYNQDGIKLGVVSSFFDNGAQVVLKLKLESQTIELPFVDAFFPYVDIEKNKIVMVEPEYD